MMDRLRGLFGEVHRRSLWQVLGVYAVTSWAGYQVVAELTDLIGLPDWVPGFAIVLFVIGLPVVLATTIVQKGGPLRRPQTPAHTTSSATLLPVDLTLTPEASALAAESRAPVPQAAAPALHKVLFTWQKAIAAGITAFLLLGITAAGYVGMRNTGVGPFGSLVAKGSLNDRERVLIADFHAEGADTSLAAAITQAFRTDFAQSPVLTLVEPSYLRGVLLRMSRDPASRLENDLAREVALRDNIKALVTGDIARAGTGYVLSARLATVSTDEVLASFRENATDSSAILPAIDRLSRKLRERVGESLRSIRADRPLEAVSTPSLEALRKYSLAVKANDMQRDFDLAESLLRDALALDSTFAMAWRKLGAVYTSSGGGEQRIAEAATRAYEYRDRLTERERYHTIAFYHLQVTGDLAQGITAYRTLLETYPTDFAAWNNLGVAYGLAGQREQAAEAYSRSTELDSTNAISYNNLHTLLLGLGRLEDAQQLVNAFRARFGETVDLAIMQFFAAAAVRDYNATERLAQENLQHFKNSPFNHSRMNHYLSDMLNVRGRLAEADRHRAAGVVADLERGAVWRPLEVELWRARIDLQARRDPAAALRRLDAALARYPMASIPLRNRQYLQAAQIYARLDRAGRARALLQDYEQSMPADVRRGDGAGLAMLQALLTVADDKFAEGIAQLRAASERGTCGINCVATEIALAFEQAGQPDSAIAGYQQFIDSNNGRRVFEDGYELASTYERLAELYETRDRQKAALYAGKFVELWQNADAGLQPRIEAKRQLLRRLNEAR